LSDRGAQDFLFARPRGSNRPRGIRHRRLPGALFRFRRATRAHDQNGWKDEKQAKGWFACGGL